MKREKPFMNWLDAKVRGKWDLETEVEGESLTGLMLHQRIADLRRTRRAALRQSSQKDLA